MWPGDQSWPRKDSNSVHSLFLETVKKGVNFNCSFLTFTTFPADKDLPNATPK